MIYSSIGGSANIWPRGAGNIGERTTFNLSMIDEEYIKQARPAMQLATLQGDMEEVFRISREDVLANLIWEAWVVGYPQTPSFKVWWPWLKNYHGDEMAAFSGPPVMYMWLDQDLKESMGY